MKDKIAVLLNHSEDLSWIEKEFGKNIRIIVHGHHVRQILKCPSLEYFYEPSSGDNKEYEEIEYLTFNWHRDNQGRDLSFDKGISPGQIISNSGWNDISIQHREYYTVKKWLDKLKILYISKNEEPLFHHVAQSFGDRIQIYDPGHSLPSLRSSCNERRLGEFPPIHRFSGIARYIQKPIISLIRRRKHLYMSSWTSTHVAREDSEGLCQNSLIPWKGYYWSKNSNFKIEAERVFPKALGDYVSPSHLKEVLSRISAKWDDSLLFLCSAYLQKSYQKNRLNFLMSYAVLREVLEYYKPVLISIPGEVSEHYLILHQIAKSMHIRTRYLGDGYGICASYPVCRDETGKNWLFDEFPAFGQAWMDHLQMRGVKKEQCILMSPPLLKHHENLPHQEKCYDAMFMTLIPMHLNPFCRKEYGGQIAVDVIRMLLKLGNRKIAIKIKFKSEDERFFYETILKAEGLLDKVQIIDGFFYEHVLKARFIIGGISSGVAEAYYHQVPYYIYEPYENGYSDAMIKESKIINPAAVARTIEQLQENILKDRIAVEVSPEYMFSGAPEKSMVTT